MYWYIEAKNHPSFAICRSLGNIQHMYMYINKFRFIYNHRLFFQKNKLCNFTHKLCPQKTSDLLSRCQQVSTRIERLFWNQLCNTVANPNKSVHPISLQQIHTVHWSRLNIVIESFRDNYAYRKIRESLLGSAGVGMCPVLSDQCTFGLVNQQAGK